MFGRRSDATLVGELSPLRRFMPFLSPRRNESLVYFATEIDVEEALRFIEDRNAARGPERRMTLFHLLLRSLALALHERPGVNRFIKGGRVWQRDGVYLTFTAKQELVDGAPVVTVKRRFEPDESLDAMVDGILGELVARRGGKRTSSDREMGFALRLPPSLLRVAMAFMAAADALGALPRSMIEPDPMYASAFVANLGSVGLDAGYHHLWEYGTCSIFAVLGRVKAGPSGRRVLEVKYSYDERVEDGLYAAITLEQVRSRLEKPESL